MVLLYELERGTIDLERTGAKTCSQTLFVLMIYPSNNPPIRIRPPSLGLRYFAIDRVTDFE